MWKPLIQAACAVAVVAGVLAAVPPVSAAPDAPPVVQTDKEKVQDPRQAAPWPGVRDATQPGSACPQTASMPLAITTPRSFAGKPPVMVFIHGGAFVNGEGATYDPAPPVGQGKVAVVTLNYRLGVQAGCGTGDVVACLLPGTNHDEGRVFVGLGAFAEYPASAYPSPALALSTVIGDGQFSCPALRAGQLAAPRPTKAVFELRYLFNLGNQLNATQKASAAQLIRYWTRFAATGNPNGAGVAYWPAFGSSQQIQSIETATAHPIAADGFSTDHHCGFWQSILG